MVACIAGGRENLRQAPPTGGMILPRACPSEPVSSSSWVFNPPFLPGDSSISGRRAERGNEVTP